LHLDVLRVFAGKCRLTTFNFGGVYRYRASVYLLSQKNLLLSCSLWKHCQPFCVRTRSNAVYETPTLRPV